MKILSRWLIGAALLLSGAALRGRAEAGAPSRFGIPASARWAHGATWVRSTLAPLSNPNPNPDPEPQPRRDHPFDLVVHPDGSRVYVALHGSELRPGHAVAVIHLATGVVTRIELVPAGVSGPPGASPTRLVFHPGGRFLIVTNRLSNFATVIDTERDQVSGEIPLDFYAQQLVFDASGERAWVAIRYLDQVLELEVKVEGDRLDARVVERGGLDEAAFVRGTPSVHRRLLRRCGGLACHGARRGGLLVVDDAEKTFRTLLELTRPGHPEESELWRAVVRTRDGGYADRLPHRLGHAGGVIFPLPDSDPDALALKTFIESAKAGPGIPVGNPRSKPKILRLARGGELLLVGNTGTGDISVVRTRSGQEVGAIRIGNVVNDLITLPLESGRELLFVSTEGVGFGVGAARDPFGQDSWDPENPAAEFSLHRDPETARVLPRSEQRVLGPADAVDGTAAIKFRDIQNDLLVIDLSELEIPEAPPADGLRVLLSPTRYEAHRAWTRYTSDTAESTVGDLHGDLPPDLMRVVGALPEKLALFGDRLLVTMQGSNLVQVLAVDPGARDPSERLRPLGTLPTGLQPIGLALGPSGTPAEGLAFVANFLGGSVSILELGAGGDGRQREVVVDPSVLLRPVPATEAEAGEIVAHTALFSADGDTSCFHCHYLDLGDGRPWGVSQVLGQVYDRPASAQDQGAGRLVIGGTMGVPQMRGLFAIQPFFFEGTLSAFEPRSMLMEHIPADDFAGPTPQGDFTAIEAARGHEGVDDLQSSTDTSTTFAATLEARREAMLELRSLEVFGKAHGLRDLVRFVGAWQVSEPRLLPDPFDAEAPAVLRGRRLFEDPRVGCVSCHPPPHFTRKDLPENPTQSIPATVTVTNRDASFTLIGMNRLDAINGERRDLEPRDTGRVETESHYTIFPLRGLWDRPPVFLHGGLARTLREVICVPGQEGLRRFVYEPRLGEEPERPGRREVGLNETWIVPAASPRVRAHMASGARLGLDTHGGVSHLRPHEIDDLVAYLQSIE